MMGEQAKRILITGGTGLLGQTLIATAPDRLSITTTYYKNSSVRSSPDCQFVPLNIEDGRAVMDLFESAQPDIVIHAAGEGNVDRAEQEPELTRKNIVVGTAEVLRASEACGAKFIYLSSNAVFNGERAPYREEDAVNPINHYGRLKVECEEMVAKARIAWAVVRPILMYGWNHPEGRSNPVTWVLQKLRSGQRLHVVDDTYCNPLWSVSCAEAIWALIDLDREGIYHVGGRDRVNRYQFAVMTAEVFGLDSSLISPVDSGFFPEIAPRPRDTTYRTAKMEKDLGIRPVSLKVGLQRMREHVPSESVPAG